MDIGKTNVIREFSLIGLEEFDHSKFENWYQVKMSQICERGGAGLLVSQFASSLPRALVSIYPEYQWLMWRFEKVPNGYWNETRNVSSYLQWFADKLNISTLEEWKLISLEQLIQHGGYFLAHTPGGLMKAVTQHFPTTTQDKFSSTKKISFKSQNFLFHCVMKLFPNLELKTDYKHPDLLFQKSSSRMELDIFIPSCNLALEYQGNLILVF